MSKISLYDLAPEPKLSDRLIGTSVGFDSQNQTYNQTYNFSLQELLDLFIPNIPSNNLQGILDNGNTATQDIHLNGTIYTTHLDVASSANFTDVYLLGQTYLRGQLSDSTDNIGSVGQVLVSLSAGGTQWETLYYVPLTRTITINGETHDLSVNRTWTVATGVMNITVDSPLGTSGGANPNLSISKAGASQDGYLSSTDWNTFNSKGTGSVTSVTAVSPISSTGGTTPAISISQSSASSNGYLSSTDWSTFNSKQIAGNYITSLTGEATAMGPGAASVTLGTSAVTGKLLTGLNLTAGGSISATDSILTAFGKTQNQISALLGGVLYKGIWDASTNTPTLTSSVGTQGWYYIVNVAGSTNLNGITDWQVGDWAIFNGTVWNKVDNTDAVSSVNGFTGAVNLTTDNVPEGTTNLYYLNSRARAALSFAAGSGAYNSTTGVITIPTDNSQILNGAAFITLGSLTASSPLSYNNTTGAFSISQASASVNGYLSSTDWTTFNSKQNTITPAALTKTDDTNVTLTLGGSPTTSLLAATSITVGWTGTLADSRITSATTWNAKQAALSGSGIVKSTAGTISYILGTSSQFVKGDGSLDSTTYGTGSVTSVGLTMPSAFSVASSPVTTSGTIAVTGAGTTSQYIRGDGTLATYNPGSGGGGSSQVFYFNGGVASSVSGYKQMSTAANLGASADFSISANGYIASFLTDSASPSQLSIPAGNWNFQIYFNSSSSGGTPSFYVELYKYDGTTFTLISSSSANPEGITNGTTVDLYITALSVPATTLLITDRLAVRVYVLNSGRTITMHTQDSNLSEVITTFSTGITALNGLTTQVQNFAVGTSGTDFAIVSATDTHTFNLPTASASNRGALSSANWTTFNNKQGAITLTTTGSSGAATFVSNTLNIPNYANGVQSLSAIGSTPNANAATITGTTLNLQPANASFGGVVTTGTQTIAGAKTFSSDLFTSGAMGIGTAAGTNISLRINKTITSNVVSYAIFNSGTVQSDVTSTVYNYLSQINTAAAAFTLSNYYHYGATQGTIGSGSAVSQQMGFFATNLTGATANFGFYGNLVSASGVWNLYMNGTASNYMAGSLGIGTTSLTGYSLKIAKTLTGAVTSYGIHQEGVIQSDVTTAAIYYNTSVQTLAASFTLPTLIHYRAIQSTIGVGSTVTNQFGFVADASLIGATNNYGFYGSLASGTNRWNLYMNGTASNFLQGELQLGSGQVVSASVLNTVTNKVKLIINGTTYYLLASTSGT